MAETGLRVGDCVARINPHPLDADDEGVIVSVDQDQRLYVEWSGPAWDSTYNTFCAPGELRCLT